MYISVASNRTHGPLKWWQAYQPGNDNDEPGGATPIAITEPPSDDREPIKEPPHQLWLSPGRGAIGLNSSAAVRTALNCRVPAVDLPDPRGYAVKSLRALWDSSRTPETASRHRRGSEAVAGNFGRRREPGGSSGCRGRPTVAAWGHRRGVGADRVYWSYARWPAPHEREPSGHRQSHARCAMPRFQCRR
jgi:hypothetical protein